MNNLRKMLAGVMAGIFVFAGVGVAESVAVSAANCGDVNNDGIISLSDLVALTKYLDGITVSEDLSEYINFELGVMRDEFRNLNKNVSVSGFPEQVRGTTVNNMDNFQVYTASGTVTANQNNYDPLRLICHNVDASSGNSGGPLYATTEYNGVTYYTVIGIHIFGKVDETTGEPLYNAATRITTDLLHFYKNNPYIIIEEE